MVVFGSWLTIHKYFLITVLFSRAGRCSWRITEVVSAGSQSDNSFGDKVNTTIRCGRVIRLTAVFCEFWAHSRSLAMSFSNILDAAQGITWTTTSEKLYSR